MTCKNAFFQLTATAVDGITDVDHRNGDDLAGIVPCVERYLRPVEEVGRANFRYRDLPNSLAVSVSASSLTPHYLGTCKGAGSAQDVWGCELARRCAVELRKAVIRDVADAVDRADAILGNAHPLAQYLTVLRQNHPSCHSVEQVEDAQHAARNNCDLRRDNLQPCATMASGPLKEALG